VTSANAWRSLPDMLSFLDLKIQTECKKNINRKTTHQPIAGSNL
jgi:hypothetical protein